jgi:hypothetical protein
MGNSFEFLCSAYIDGSSSFSIYCYVVFVELAELVAQFMKIYKSSNQFAKFNEHAKILKCLEKLQFFLLLLNFFKLSNTQKTKQQ